MAGSTTCPHCDCPVVEMGRLHICRDHGLLPPQTPPVRKRLFLSYGHDSHSSVAIRLRDDLRTRGHEVWFDEDRLLPGYDWELFIEKGLDELALDSINSAVILLLTPHSVRRPDGYCLNEIARALGRGLRVIPVMVVRSEPPLSICRIQWLDMRECIPISEHESIYWPRLERLLEAVEDGMLDFEGTQQRLIALLQPLEFDADTLDHVSRFTGRQWVFDEIDRWLTTPSAERVFWITGGPGTGKSAVSAVLSSRYPEVVGFHMCRLGHAQKGDARRAVTSLAYQLSTQLPEYEAQLGTMHLENLVDDDAATIFDNIVVQPLTRIAAPGRQLILLIDGLDEATSDGRNELAEFIATEFSRTPKWLRLIVTSRRQQEVMVPLQGLTPLEIDAHGDAVRGDIGDYVRGVLAPLLEGRSDAERLVELLVAQSEGVFLYAERVCHDLLQGHLSLDRPGEFPQSLGSAFYKLVRRQFPDIEQFGAGICPLLRAVVAAREPLRRETLRALVDLQDERLAGILRTIQPLFSVGTDREHGAIRPCHSFLLEWLTDEERAGPYYVSVNEGHRMLAGYCREKYDRIGPAGDAYVTRHMLSHLRAAGEFAEVFDVVADERFVSAFLSVAPADALRREMGWSWAVAVEAGGERLVRQQHPLEASLAQALCLVEEGRFTDAIGLLRGGLQDKASVMEILALNELCWLAKDHLPPADAQSVILDGAGRLTAAVAVMDGTACPMVGIEAARTIGWMLKDLGGAAEARSAFHTALELSERAGNQRQIAWSARDLGCWYRDAHEFEPARECFLRSTAEFRALGDDRQLAVSLKDMGLLLLEQSCTLSSQSDASPPLSLGELEESLQLADMLGDSDLSAWVSRYLGIGEARLGLTEAGRERVERTAEQFYQFRDTNIALTRFCAAHVDRITRPALIERFGHSHNADADFRELMQ